MIVLDTSVLVAHFAERDAHSERAFEILDTEEELTIHPLTVAEALVRPTHRGDVRETLDKLDRIGVEVWQPDRDQPVRLARLRAETRLKLPDCCILDMASIHNASLATFDARLAAAARARGVDVLGVAGSD